MTRLGYCCINLSLKDKKVNRGMKRQTFMNKGLNYCAELALKNIEDTFDILKWNLNNGIYVYRMSSNIFPWMSEYELKDLPNYDKIKNVLCKIGDFVTKNNIRIGFHPGPFNVLASDNERVVKNTIKEINQHALILDEMGLPISPYYGINIHVNNSQPDKDNALKRFIDNFCRLSESSQKRLTVENDDKLALYTPLDLIKLSEKINDIYNVSLPVVFDNLHYEINSDLLCHKFVINQCKKTWGDYTPLLHWSSSKKNHEDITSSQVAHADYLYGRINIPEGLFDVEIEAKAKDLALLRYISEGE